MGRAPKTLTAPQRALVLVFALVRVAVFALIAYKGVTIKFYVLSHLAITIESVLYVALALSLFYEPALRHELMLALPMLVALPAIISFLIVYFVYNFEHIYTNVIKCGVAGLFARMHTQDFFVHSFPPFEALLVLLAVQRVARYYVREFWEAACVGRSRRILYCAYVCSAGLVPVVAYHCTVDWQPLYYADVGGRALLGIALASLCVGAVLLVCLLPRTKQQRDKRCSVADADADADATDTNVLAYIEEQQRRHSGHACAAPRIRVNITV